MDVNAADSNGVWRNHSNQWQQVGAPLRPSARDGELMMGAAGPALPSSPFDNDQVAVAILGVTPEVVSLPWPSHIRLEAFDQSAEMIAAVWHPHPNILAAFEALFPDRLDLARRANWPLEAINTIDAYRGAPTRYNFPTLHALQEISAPFFKFETVHYGDYELAERCPTVRLRSCYNPPTSIR